MRLTIELHAETVLLNRLLELSTAEERVTRRDSSARGLCVHIRNKKPVTSDQQEGRRGPTRDHLELALAILRCEVSLADEHEAEEGGVGGGSSEGRCLGVGARWLVERAPARTASSRDHAVRESLSRWHLSFRPYLLPTR